jgi:hypothetical protein
VFQTGLLERRLPLICKPIRSEPQRHEVTKLGAQSIGEWPRRTRKGSKLDLGISGNQRCAMWLGPLTPDRSDGIWPQKAQEAQKPINKQTLQEGAEEAEESCSLLPAPSSVQPCLTRIEPFCAFCGPIIRLHRRNTEYNPRYGISVFSRFDSCAKFSSRVFY